MPIYEYKCAKCGKVSEFLRNIGDESSSKCPGCGSEKMEKLFSTFAPRIKEGESKKCHGCTDGACPHSGH